MPRILKEDATGEGWPEPVDFTETAIISQMLADARFGREKATNKRGISSDLMAGVCRMWCWILEDEEILDIEYDDYGLEIFLAIIDKYHVQTSEEELLQKITETGQGVIENAEQFSEWLLKIRQLIDDYLIMHAQQHDALIQPGVARDEPVAEVKIEFDGKEVDGFTLTSGQVKMIERMQSHGWQKIGELAGAGGYETCEYAEAALRELEAIGMVTPVQVGDDKAGDAWCLVQGDEQ